METLKAKEVLLVTSNTTQVEAGSAVVVEPDQAFGSSSEDTGGGFPTDTLPPRVKDFVEECAASLPVAPDLVALPVLVAVGTAIGNTRSIRLKDDWTEPASLYGTIIADTGSMKSPALQAALQPILDAQASGKKRLWTSDPTVEQLGVLLQHHPRGLLLFRDELTGWVSSLNQYRGGRGSDRQFYLSAYSGTPITVDRKLSEVIIVPRPFVSVVGAIQPSLLHHLDGREGDEDGFMQRLLFAFPESVPGRWSGKEVTAQVKQAYAELVSELLNLEWDNRTPTLLPLTSTAQTLFSQWVNDLYKEMESPDLQPPLRGFYAKLKGSCARLALIHGLARDPGATAIDEGSVMAAAAQVDYFKAQAAKVVDRLCRCVGVGTPLERCKEAIRRKLRGSQRCKKREIQRCTNYDAKVFNQAFEALSTPELIKEPDDTYHLRTDIPTTDTTDNGNGGKE